MFGRYMLTVLLGCVFVLGVNGSGAGYASEMEATLSDSTINSGFTIQNPSPSIIARFRGDGLVGIGTANPTERLKVIGGNVKISTTGSGVIFPDGTKQTTASAGGGGGTVSGTVNKIAKFTSANAVGDSAITEVGGKVGIGTTSPLVDLDIANPSSLYLRLAAGTNADNAIVFKTGTVQRFLVGQRFQDEATFRIQSEADWGVTSNGFFFNSGNVGIGTVGLTEKLHIQANIADQLTALIENTQTSSGSQGSRLHLKSLGNPEIFFDNKNLNHQVLQKNRQRYRQRFLQELSMKSLRANKTFTT